ncbi:MAG: sodium:solute symporter family protein [Eubacterium sp.]|nr:sodium:solute symporter family protein [Eubacterium sp.]
MNYGVLVAVLIYEVLSIGIVSLVISRKNKNKNEEGGFAFAGGGLPASLVGITLALTLLGSAHNWGTCQNAASMGVIAAWFGIACAIMMVVITQIFGPWIRRTGARTIGEFMGKIFGRMPGRLITCVNAALVVGMCCLEVEAIAITFSMLTGWSYTVGAIVGGIIAVAYVLIAGMKEIAWLNLINAIIMYAAMILVFICLCVKLPGGWDQVEATMQASQDTSWMTSIFGNSALIIGFAIPSAIGASLFHSVSQTGFQPVATAKNNKEVKKSGWYAGIINGCFCIIPALIGVAAFSIIQYKQAGDMMMTPTMLAAMLPKPVLGLLMAGFLGVDLSSFAVMSLAPATLISHDMYTKYKPNATEKQKTTLTRVCIIIIGVIAICICNFQPAVVDMVNWSFAFGIPIFVMVLLGLWWKRSTTAAVITFVVTWIAVCIWTTFGLQTTLGLANFHVDYISLLFSIPIGIITTAVCKGKPGYFRDKKKKAAA